MLKSRILYLAVLTLSLLMILFFNEAISYVAAYALLLLPVCSLATILAAKLTITVEEHPENHYAFKNEDFSYQIVISNKSRLPYPRVQLAFYNSELIPHSGGSMYLPAKGALKKQYVIRFPHRGVFNVGVKRVSVIDFLGLFRIAFTPKKRLSVVVYPEMDESFTLSLANEAMEHAAGQNLLSHSTEVSDVRKYALSDDYKTIHWKLTAKRGELMVKEYQSIAQNKTFLILDTTALSLAEDEKAIFEDKMISFTASAINYCVKKQMPVEFTYGGADMGRVLVRSWEELDGIFPLLAGIPFDGKQSCFQSDHPVALDADMSDIVLFLHHIDDEIFECVKNNFLNKRHVLLYYFYSSELPLTEAKHALLEGLASLGAGISMVRA